MVAPNRGRRPTLKSIHPSITEGRILQVIEEAEVSLDNPGICVDCGEDAEGVEPDARYYECSSCNKRGVFGAEQILMEGIYHK